MIYFPHHMDKALSAHQCLPEEQKECQPEGGEKILSPSPSHNPTPHIIQGELIALTGDPRTAAILGHLLYWSQQVEDFDLFLEEERNSYSKDHVFERGWFHRPVIALMEETMLRVTIVTFRRYLRFLVDRGWVQTRLNSQNKWTGGRQYRVNLRKLNHDLQKKGYSLPYGRSRS